MDGVKRVAMVETKTVDTGIPGWTPVPRWRFQLDNHLGSACLEVDEVGAVIGYEEYHAYGTTAYQATKSGVDVSAKRYRYTGKERDEETGFYYHGARYYAAWLGRWVSADPLGVQAGINVYLYGRASPVVFTDPSGLDVVLTGAKKLDNVSDADPVGPYAEIEQQEFKARFDQAASTFPSRKATPVADKTNAFVKGAGGGDVRADRTKARDVGWGSVLLDKVVDAAASVPGSPIAAYRTARAVVNADKIAEGVGKQIGVLSGGDSAEKEELLYEIAGAGARFLAEALIAKKAAIPEAPVARQGTPELSVPTSMTAAPLVRYDPDFAAAQILKTTSNVTAGGRTLSVHAAERMMDPPAGRAPTTMAEVDTFLDSATRVRKISHHPMGDTITLQNANAPRVKEIAVDAATGKRVITVITPRRR